MPFDDHLRRTEEHYMDNVNGIQENGIGSSGSDIVGRIEVVLLAEKRLW